MWIESDNKLVREFKFKDFSRAFSFMTMIAFLAEKENHHPELISNYNRLIVKWQTHDSGNIVTEKDRRMAAATDVLFKEYN